MRNFLEYIDEEKKIKPPVVCKLSKGKTFPLGLSSKNIPVNSKKTKTTDKAFGELGDESLKTKFHTEKPPETYIKIPIAEQIGISNTLIENCVNDPSLIETIVRQMKKEGLLSLLIAEIFEHNESYQHVGEIMAHEHYGPSFCHKLAKAMNEQTGPPFSDQLDNELNKPKKPKTPPQPDMQPGKTSQPDMQNQMNPGSVPQPDMQNDPSAMQNQMNPGSVPQPDMQSGNVPPMPQSNDQSNPLGLPQLPPAMQNMNQAMMRKFMFR